MKLIGYVGGAEIAFSFCPPNIFKAEIPKNQNGIYIVELHAVDDAGNQTGYTNMFVKIDFQQLKVSILPPNYNFIENGVNLGYKELQSKYDYLTENTGFYAKEFNKYSYKELISE